MTQKKQIVLDANPQEPESKIVKVERNNNQDILRDANTTDSIRILLSKDVRSSMNEPMQSIVCTGDSLQGIEGTDVHILWGKMNMNSYSINS